MTATRSTPDPLFKLLVSTVLDDKTPIKACLSGLGINTYRVLLDLMKDHNKVNSLKWRNGSTDEDLPDPMKDQLKFFPRMSTPAKTNEMIITFRGSPPPSVSEDVGIPDSGLASRMACATNQAEGERRMNITFSLLMMMNAGNCGEIWGTTVREYGEQIVYFWNEPSNWGMSNRNVFGSAFGDEIGYLKTLSSSF